MDHDTLTPVPASVPVRPATVRAVPFAPPCIGPEEEQAVLQVLRSGWVTTGPAAAQFEHEFAEFVGAESALALSSCTAGLLAALAVSGVGPGDAVLVPTLTFAATANVVELLGARTVLVDVDPDTLTLDPAAVERALARLRTDGVTPRALMPVHYAGHPADIDALDALADEHALLVLEDAAHALPAASHGRRIGGARSVSGGQVASLASFSFYANKNVTTGEGGMLTGPEAVLRRARSYTHHGLSRAPWRRGRGAESWRYEVAAPGLKLNMSDIAAAIGRVQLKRLPEFHARRVAVAAQYAAAFSALDALHLPVERTGCSSAWHLYPVRIATGALRIDRDAVARELALTGVQTSVHFVPLHEHEHYARRYGHAPDAFPVAHAAAGRLLSLPIHPALAQADVEHVIEALAGILRRHRR